MSDYRGFLAVAHNRMANLLVAIEMDLRRFLTGELVFGREVIGRRPLQALFARGVLALGTHNISYAHRDEDLKMLDAAYAGALAVVKDAVAARAPAKFLRCKPLEPLFKVR